MNGILLINKESGPTSYAVVDRLKKLSGIKKVGHTGTLDPMAEGLLVICFGKATKSIRFMDTTKEYEAVMQLGITTDTLDKAGKILGEIPYQHITRFNIEKILPQFRGKILQVPPMFSALKKGGRRLYELAREGKTVKREPRQIEISKLELTNFSPPFVRLSVTCSGGTYIRSLCDDIGKALGCGAILYHLCRTRIGPFRLSQAVKLSKLSSKENIVERLLSD